MIDQVIGFVGAGQMARALAGGIVRSELVPGNQIWASDPYATSRQAFAAQVPGGHVVEDNGELARQAQIVFLAVKPQQLDGALTSLQANLGKQHLVISICAGVPLAKIAEPLDDSVRLIRVMPNQACLVGQGASAYSVGTSATKSDGQVAHQLLSSVGLAVPVDEKLLDAVTGLSGSGPAFVYLVIEALSDGGVLMGLPRDVASALAAQTVLGSAQMVTQTGEHPATLRDRVASPGGTTIAGIEALERSGARSAFIAAIRAATRRSIELGKE